MTADPAPIDLLEDGMRGGEGESNWRVALGLYALGSRGGRQAGSSGSRDE